MAETCTRCPDDPGVAAPGAAIQTGSRPTGAQLTVTELDCPSEEAVIRKLLAGVPGAGQASFDYMQRRVTLPPEADPEAAEQAIRAGGFTVAKTQEVGTALDAGASETGLTRREVVLMAAAGAAAIGSEVVAWSSGNETSWPVGVLAAAAIALGGIDTLKKGWTALCTFTLNINLLMMIAVIGAIIIGQWPEAAVVIWLFGIAEAIEKLAVVRARNAVRALMQLAPETALVKQADGTVLEVASSHVAVGAAIHVRPGQRVPLDGVVTAGHSAVDEAPITGESIPVDKAPGARVFAGTINQQGLLEVNVTAAAGNTTLARIVRTVQEAQATRAPTQRFVDQFARYYTPAVVLVALAVAIVPPLAFGGGWFDWLYKALVLLVIACPCALVISTPVTVVSGLAAAARRGILVKGGLFLEQGRRLRVLAVDKTGTLTEGKPALIDVLALDGFAERDARRLAASLDSHSEHPVARAIVAGWTEKAGLAEVAGFESLPGRGVRGTIDGTTYLLGNRRLASENGALTAELDATLNAQEAQGRTTVILIEGSRALAVFAVADKVRAESRQAVARLADLGVRTVMLTGDNERTAQAVAAELGISQVRAQMLPEDKLAAIQALQREIGPVGMVGDGVNDAPALAQADIGIAMGMAGTDVAVETADVALMKDDLRRVADFIGLSKATSRVLWQNITVALGLKAIVFALAMAGVASLWLAVLADVGASLLVVANGLRLLRTRSLADR